MLLLKYSKEYLAEPILSFCIGLAFNNIYQLNFHYLTIYKL